MCADVSELPWASRLTLSCFINLGLNPAWTPHGVRLSLHWFQRSVQGIMKVLEKRCIASNFSTFLQAGEGVQINSVLSNSTKGDNFAATFAESKQLLRHDPSWSSEV